MKRLVILSFLCVTIGLAVQPMRAGGQAASNFYNKPLAYIGEDGNVYITEVGEGTGTRLTNDAKMPDPQENLQLSEGSLDPANRFRRYGSIRWSADGTGFAFVEQYSRALFIVESGRSPRLVNPDIKVGYLLGRKALAWSPDGTQLAYATGSPGAPQGLDVVSLADGTTRTVVSELDGAFVADGPGSDDIAAAAYYDELGSTMFASAVTLYWTAYGFLYRTGTLVLADSNGHNIWRHGVSATEDYAFSYAIPEARDVSAFALQYFPGQQKVIPGLIDLPSGKFAPMQGISVDPMARAYALSPDGETLIYVTTEPGGAVEGDPGSAIGKALFGAGWPIDGQSYAVTLWRQSLSGGDPVSLFTKGYYDIPTISPAPDSSGVAISFITASAETIKKINVQTSREEILAAFPHPEIYYVNLISAKPQFIARGGQPAFGKGTFVAVRAD